MSPSSEHSLAGERFLQPRRFLPHTPSPAMALTKLNPYAPPYMGSIKGHLFPPPPPTVQLYHAAACMPPLPFITIYSGLLPIPDPHTAKYSVPLPPPPPPPPYPGKSFPSLPHGQPPHKLVAPRPPICTVADKPQFQVTAKVRPAVAVIVKQERADAATPRRRGALVSKGVPQLQARRGRTKEYMPRQAEPAACARPARSPSPVFTTRPPWPAPEPEWGVKPITTVMIRNIPSKLTRYEMMQLLDDHCARANKKKRRAAGRSAYDFLYLPMDFSKERSSNKGYAFVNLTTVEAARGLHYSLHGSGWKVFGSSKVIEIRSARIQGKETLVNHFSRSTFACHTGDYLPAAFSPPRDGHAARVTAASPELLGHRVPPRRQQLIKACPRRG